MDDFLLSVQAFVHVFAEEGLRNFFDVIAITYEKGAKSSLYRALPDITSNRRYIGSPPCQQIPSSLYRPFRYSGPRYIWLPTVPGTCHRLIIYVQYLFQVLCLFFSFFFPVLCLSFFSIFNVPRLMACVCCACCFPYDGLALHCLLSSLHHNALRPVA